MAGDQVEKGQKRIFEDGSFMLSYSPRDGLSTEEICNETDLNPYI
jgi:hypothetical protein